MQSVQPASESNALAHSRAFLIGQDRAGHWVAIETHGRGGGVFTSRDAALTYARAETDRRTDAVRFSTEPIALR